MKWTVRDHANRRGAARLCLIGAVVPGLLFTAIAGAQTLPGSAAPGQLEKRFEPVPEPQSLPALSVPLPQGKALGAGAEKAVIPLQTIALEGNTVIDAETLAPLWQDLLGRKVSLAELTQLAEAITAHYRNAGYILTRVVLPEQRVSDGTVRLQVVESYIGDYEITGQVPPGGEQLLQTWARRIQASRPLHIDVMEHYLLLADALPGYKVQGRITAAPDGEAGASLLTLVVEYDPWDIRWQVDNHGSEAIGPHQGFVSFTRHGTFTPFSATTLSLSSASDTDELRYLALNHEQVVGEDGTRLTLGATKVDSEPGAALAPLQLKSRTRSAEIGFSRPLSYRRAARADLYGGFAWRRFRSDAVGEPLSADDLRVVQLGIRTDFADRYAGLTLVDVALHQGLRILGASKAGDPNLSRAGADGQFTKLTAQAVRIQPLVDAWSLYGVVSAQFAFDSLLASEEFAYGGSSIGRGYDPSELTGDHGLSALLELRYGRGLVGSPIASVQPFAFYDFGAVWDKDSDADVSAASAGLGLRFSFAETVDAGIYVAKPLTRPSAEGEGSRVFFNLGARY